MTFEFAVGAFVIFGGFAFMCILADYILPAFFENDGLLEWRNDGDYLE